MPLDFSLEPVPVLTPPSRTRTSISICQQVEVLTSQGAIMGAPRTRKPLIKSRRRVADEGEEEEGSVATGAEEDSLSEGSVISDADDDADGEGSDGSGSVSPAERDSEGLPAANGHSRSVREVSRSQPSASSRSKAEPPAAMNDTIAMMNGLEIGDVPEGPELHFDDLIQDSTSGPEGNSSMLQKPDQQLDNTTHGSASGPEKSGLMSQAEGEEGSLSVVGKGRREHEEYKKRRDADPAFVPNRGGFFMHDHRSAAPGQNGFRPFGRGRGRGRSVGTFSSFGYVPSQP